MADLDFDLDLALLAFSSELLDFPGLSRVLPLRDDRLSSGTFDDLELRVLPSSNMFVSELVRANEPRPAMETSLASLETSVAATSANDGKPASSRPRISMGMD